MKQIRLVLLGISKGSEEGHRKDTWCLMKISVQFNDSTRGSAWCFCFCLKKKKKKCNNNMKEFCSLAF